MIRLTGYLHVGAALGACIVAFAAVAQTVDAPPAPTVGDKWTYRYHNKGDKREPYLYTQEVKFSDGASAWLHGDSQEPNARRPKYVWRVDVAKAAFVERFELDPAATNGAGKRVTDRQANDSWLQFPMAVGSKFKVKSNWDNGQGFDEYTAEVQAFEKVKVEAGEFDAYRIKYSGYWNQRQGGNYSGRAEQTTWYAPAVKGSVKWNYSNRTGNGQAWNDTYTELVKWEPGAVK